MVTASFVSLLTVDQAAAASFVVTNTNDSGFGSLRQAITSANATTESDAISFAVGSGQIRIIPASPLPPIIYPVVLDGTTQPGFSSSPIVEISGYDAGSGARGLYITNSGRGSTIKGLVINRFSAQGIWIDTSDVTIIGNYIGTNTSGTVAAGNGGDGIAIFSGSSAESTIASNNRIGGSTEADRNVVSGNVGNGIGITAQDGGVANNNKIYGNYIGTNASGTGPLANGGDGILVNHADGGGPASAQSTLIGGSVGTTPNGLCSGECNLVSGNGANGIGLWHGGVSGSIVYGNYVGTDKFGTSPIANGNIGIEVNEAPNNTVGGTTPAQRNIFSGNGGSGVFLTGAAATGNVIQGNYIGTNVTGSGPLKNQKMGLGIGSSPGAVGANSNTIGGTNGITPGGACTGSCNLISGNQDNGIFISGVESYGHIIRGNYIGTNAAGTSGVGNGLDGIGLLSAQNNTIGGSNANERNIISANGSNGVIIVGGSSTGNAIRQNFIGKGSAGNSLGNQASGISVSAATDNDFLLNSIAFNGLMGIDLDNNGTPNQNDLGDSDNGANHLQNFPVIHSAKTTNGTTKIGGQYNAAPNSSSRIEFFSSDGCNAGAPNDYGEGQDYLGYIDVTVDRFGNSSFGFTSPTTVAGNKYITATATSSDTSEFSQCKLVNTSKAALTNGATWFQKNNLVTGPADYTFSYGFPSFFLMCAWDGSQPGVKLPTIFANGQWFMRASYTTGTADRSFYYGNGTHSPICGDWDGDGIDTPGVVTGDGTWHLRNTNWSGPPDAGQFQYGPDNATPLAGDWDGDGDDTIGVALNNNKFYLRNSNDGGSADAGTISYGHTPGYAIVGDWDGDGDDTIGSVSIGGTWSLRNTNSAGAPDSQFQFGFPGAVPLLW